MPWSGGVGWVVQSSKQLLRRQEERWGGKGMTDILEVRTSPPAGVAATGCAFSKAALHRVERSQQPCRPCMRAPSKLGPLGQQHSCHCLQLSASSLYNKKQKQQLAAIGRNWLQLLAAVGRAVQSSCNGPRLGLAGMAAIGCNWLQLLAKQPSTSCTTMTEELPSSSTMWQRPPPPPLVTHPHKGLQPYKALL